MFNQSLCSHFLKFLFLVVVVDKVSCECYWECKVEEAKETKFSFPKSKKKLRRAYKQTSSIFLYGHWMSLMSVERVWKALRDRVCVCGRNNSVWGRHCQPLLFAQCKGSNSFTLAHQTCKLVLELKLCVAGNLIKHNYPPPFGKKQRGR